MVATVVKHVSTSALVDYNTNVTTSIIGPLTIDGAILRPEVIEFASFLYANIHLLPQDIREAWYVNRTKAKLLG